MSDGDEGLVVRAAEDHDRLDRIARWFKRRWVIPVVALGLVAWTVWNSATEQGNKSQIVTINTNVVIETALLQQLETTVQGLEKYDTNQSAAQAKSSAVLNAFFVEFIAEQNYLCNAAVIHNKTLGGPPAPAGICDVSLGAPRAPPTPVP